MKNKDKIVKSVHKAISQELKANGYKTKEQQGKVMEEVLMSLSPSYSRRKNYHKTWLQARKDKGICVSCNEPAVEGKRRCKDCARKHSIANGKYLRAKRESHHASAY